MPELHETRMGQKLINKDIPKLIQAINRLAAALEKAAAAPPTTEPRRKERMQIWKKESE